MLPGPYERWFVELAGRASPVETRSTCDQCAMLPEAAELPPTGPFSPEVRCCSFHPTLAPHLVGGILAGDSDEGRARVRARIAGRLGVSPLGIGPPPAYLAAQALVAGEPGGGFGQRGEILCPFHEAARCTIWQHRGMACAAFHCKLDRGALGQHLWNLLVVGWNAVERVVARWLIGRLGLDGKRCDALLHAPEDAAVDAAAWGQWRGREEAFFVEAARLVEALSWGEVAALGGRHLAGFEAAVRGALVYLDGAPPLRVRRNDEVLHQIGRGPGSTRLQNRTVPFDLLEVPSELATRLARLEESAVADLGLDERLLRQLLDWQVLTPAQDP